MDKLYVISKEDCFDGEVELVNRLFEAGMDVFHLRKPGASLQRFADIIGEIDPAFRHRLVLHQFHEYGPEWGVGRFHFSELKRSSLIKEKIHSEDMTSLNFKAGLSTSIHSSEQVNDLSTFDYSFFGPVFNSISKPGYASTLPPGFELPSHFRTKLVALGGISAENIDKVFEMGFDKVAVLGAIWEKPMQALDSFKILKERCQYAQV